MKTSLLASVLLLLVTAVSAYGQALSGDYVIGTGQTYTSLAAAIAALNANGASSTVRFLIDEDLNETGSPCITSSTLNGTNTLVIKPNSGKTPTVTFTSCVTTGNNAYSGLTIDGSAAAVGYVTIDGSNTEGGTTRDMTFVMNDGTAGKYCLSAVGDADYVTVKNCRFGFTALMDQGVSGNRGAGIRSQGTGASVTIDNLTIRNNEIGSSTQAAGYGIYVNNASATYSSAVTIEDNVVYGSTVPINVLRGNTGATSLNITGNTVYLIGYDVAAGYSHYAVWVDQSGTTVNIKNNEIAQVKGYNNSGSNYPVYGIYAGRQVAGSTLNIANNMIMNFAWQGTDKAKSIIIGVNLVGTTTSTYNVYYNTIYLNGDSLDGNTSSLIGFSVTSANSIVNLKNNILVNAATTDSTFAIRMPSTTNLTSNYNDVYVSGSSPNVGLYAGVARKALSDWQNASGQDANSVSVDPANPFGAAGQLKSLTDLHWFSKPSDVFAATPLGAPYTTDIDGDARDATYPYMGADEIPGQPLPVQMASFSLACAGRGAVLSWTTATEVNNYGFDIERRQVSNLQSAISTLQWIKIGFVPGAGTSAAVREYRYVDEGVKPGRYAYRVKQINNDGTFAFVAEGEVLIGEVPGKLTLEQNYPNPFNPTTVMRFYVPSSAPVWLTIYDATGREVQKIADGEVVGEGYHEAVFDARGLSSGAYFTVLRTPEMTVTKQMMLLK